MIEGHRIDVFSYGKTQRGGNYIDDIVEGGLDQPAQASESFDGLASDPACSNVSYCLLSIGNDRPVNLLAASRPWTHPWDGAPASVSCLQ